ncbi:40S ribosomal protein S16 [Striga asiatica]|uniref:40S ribosomal protein S16 n=1 Tax=Striga asiatica TaxID=4170 RepID=A0A5A7QAI3_STRAF|nr:40S ribosomal protein S16 [Striga asiatica]
MDTKLRTSSGRHPLNEGISFECLTETGLVRNDQRNEMWDDALMQLKTYDSALGIEAMSWTTKAIIGSWITTTRVNFLDKSSKKTEKSSRRLKEAQELSGKPVGRVRVGSWGIEVWGRDVVEVDFSEVVRVDEVVGSGPGLAGEDERSEVVDGDAVRGDEARELEELVEVALGREKGRQWRRRGGPWWWRREGWSHSRLGLKLQPKTSTLPEIDLAELHNQSSQMHLGFALNHSSGLHHMFISTQTFEFQKKRHTIEHDGERATATNLSTVGFLEPGAGTTPTELLRLAAPRVGHQQRPVVPHENVLDLLLRLLVDVLLVECNEGLGDRLADGVDLGGVAAALDAYAHVDAGEAVAAEEEDWLEHLVAEDLGLDELDRDAVDLDKAAAALAVGDRDGRFLAAEALDGFGWRRHGCVSCCFSLSRLRGRGNP